MSFIWKKNATLYWILNSLNHKRRFAITILLFIIFSLSLSKIEEKQEEQKSYTCILYTLPDNASLYIFGGPICIYIIFFKYFIVLYIAWWYPHIYYTTEYKKAVNIYYVFLSFFFFIQPYHITVFFFNHHITIICQIKISSSISIALVLFYSFQSYLKIFDRKS